MGAFDVLSIGVSALYAMKKSLEVTSENIANANTEGYSKQTAILAEGMPNLDNRFTVGSGVKVSSINRTYDDFLQRQMVNSNSASGNYNTQQTAMQRVEQLFNEFSSSGLGTDLTSFFNAWQDLADDPSGQAERQAVLAQGNTLVSDFQQMNDDLDQVKNDANQTLKSITSEINSQLQQIATLNGQIQQVDLIGGNANELRDSRDLLVQQLSSKIGITYLNNSDGTLTITLPQGGTLVSGNQAGSLTLDDKKVILNGPGGPTNADVTQVLQRADGNQGEIGATLQVRDSLVDGFISGLDDLAYTLATAVNGVHRNGHSSLTNSTGNDFFSNPDSMDGYSRDIEMGITDINQIATAKDPTDPNSGNMGDNIVATRIAALATQSFTMSTGNSTLSAFYNSLVGKAGVAAQTAEQGATQSSASLTQLKNMRDTNSGVSLDEELANLMAYQKSYEGAAKMISTGTDMLDTVLALIQ